MIKILTAKQIRELDQATIINEPVSSIDLMERASQSFVTWFTERFHALHKVGIICGTGNNGGDGLAIARLLKDWGYPVKVWIVRGGTNESGDFRSNLERLNGVLEVIEISSNPNADSFNHHDVLIDAMFGSGLSRPVEGVYADVIAILNTTETIRVAVDIPSGLMVDSHQSGPIVRADYTVTFQLPKLSFFFPQYFEYTGEWFVVDIGLAKNFIREAETSHFMLSKKGVRKLFRSRSRFDHKGTFGHAFLFTGSFGKIGAAVLTTMATLRSGAGLTTVAVPACGYSILQMSTPEAMVIADEHPHALTTLPDISKATVIGVGPGLGQHGETKDLLKNLLSVFSKPMVIDADALNIIAENPEWLGEIPPGSILTPHPGEFKRLVGEWSNDFERLEKQRHLAQEIKGVIVLKGAFTSIVSPDGTVYFNPTGNPGMATGGSGDVLTGILTGLLAQGYESVEAAILGVYLHGLSGDLAVLETGPESLIASDLVRFLPSAFRQIRR